MKIFIKKFIIPVSSLITALFDYIGWNIVFASNYGRKSYSQCLIENQKQWEQLYKVAKFI